MDYLPLRSKAPPSSILSPAFVYRSAAQTDIRLTFEKYRREQQIAAGLAELKAAEIGHTVQPFKRKSV